MGRTLFRWAIWPMFVLLLWAAYLQTNDPDPWVWIGFYGGVACLSLLAFFGVGHRWLTCIVSSGAFLVGCYLAFYVIGQQHLFNSEEGREMMGLWLVSLWLGGVYWLQSSPGKE